jgi:HEAT repeat protein
VRRDEVLTFLQAHQPLPPRLDERLHGSLLDVYEYVKRSTDVALLPLLLGIFGEGDAGGVYFAIVTAVSAYPREELVAAAVCALASERASVRYWVAHVAAECLDARFVPSLSKLLSDADAEVRYISVIALEAIASNDAKRVLQEALVRESEPELRDLMRDALDTTRWGDE